MAKKKYEEPVFDKQTSFNHMVRVYLAARHFLDEEDFEKRIEKRADLLAACDNVSTHLHGNKQKTLKGL